jgi:uroporphyrinogen decarboxylase
MNKRDHVLEVVSGRATGGGAPAAFFMHFPPECHVGQAAIDQHLRYFRSTGMDLLKIQYELPLPTQPAMHRPGDWARAPRWTLDDFAPMLAVVDGLVKALHHEALVIVTLYSPFMWASHLADSESLRAQLAEQPEAVVSGLEILTENVITFAHGCQRLGVDGFYVSTQGGEAFRFGGTEIFEKTIRPTDLAVWDAIGGSLFNILHVCDYHGPYADLTPFLRYPGRVVSTSLALESRTLTAREVQAQFGRPVMGGLERKGVLATGPAEAIRAAVTEALADRPEGFILAADCTVPSDTPWDHLKLAVDLAHAA